MAIAAAFISPRMAVDQLEALRNEYWRCDPPEAIARLQWLLGRTDILQLYQANFPAQYRKSKAARRAEKPNGYSPLELEFFALVAKHLFPIADLCFDEDERCDWIPVETAALDPEGIEDWRTAWQVVFALAQDAYTDVDWNKVAESLPAEAELPAPVIRRGEYEVDWKRFLRRAARADPHLKHLEAMLSMVTFNTGNNFLDITPDMMGSSEMPDWTQENIDWLAKEWQKAQPIIDRAMDVGEWLEAEPQRLADLIRCWNKCITFKETAEEATDEEEG